MRSRPQTDRLVDLERVIARRMLEFVLDTFAAERLAWDPADARAALNLVALGAAFQR